MQQSQPFGAQFSAEPAHSGDVLARTVEAGDETGFDRIAAEYENDWDRRRRRLDRERAGTDRDDHGRLPFDQVRGQRWQPSKLPLTPAEGDLNVLAVDMTGFAQALVERCDEMRQLARRPVGEKPDHRQRRLLRAHSKRPRDGRAAEQRDEIAPFHGLPPDRPELCCHGARRASRWES